MHFLTYHINKVLLMTSLLSVGIIVACVDAANDYYYQNDNVIITALEI